MADGQKKIENETKAKRQKKDRVQSKETKEKHWNNARAFMAITVVVLIVAGVVDIGNGFDGEDGSGDGGGVTTVNGVVNGGVAVVLVVVWC